MFAYSRPVVVRAAAIRESSTGTAFAAKLVPFGFSGQENVNVALIANEIGSFSSILDDGVDVVSWLEDIAGSGWKSYCKSVELAMELGSAWT